MNHRDQLAMNAPVTPAMVTEIMMGKTERQDGSLRYRSFPDLFKDDERAAFFAIWAALRYEYADAMVREARGNAR